MSAGLDGQARIWDLRNGRQLQSLACNFKPNVRSSGKCKAVYLSNDNFVASISSDIEYRDVRLHEARSGRILGDLKHHTR